MKERRRREEEWGLTEKLIEEEVKTWRGKEKKKEAIMATLSPICIWL